jgi:hypothetical protein
MKPIKYSIISLGTGAGDNTFTEFVNSTLARLNEDEAPILNDIETHWELDNMFICENFVFFVFAQWTGRY